MKTVTCDICEKNCDDAYATLLHVFGYGSEQDGNKIHIHICEQCLIKKFEDHIEEIK